MLLVSLVVAVLDGDWMGMPVMLVLKLLIIFSVGSTCRGVVVC